MRYLIFSDIHANLEALEAVLGDAGEFDGALFLGDVVGYGPNPNECVDRLRSLPHVTALVGNHDLVALRHLRFSEFNEVAAAAALWTSNRLTPANRAYLESLNPALSSDELALAHGSPRDPVWEYLESEEQGAANFGYFDTSLCLVGHTHVPRVFELNRATRRMRVWRPRAGDTMSVTTGLRYMINPGSVGQPRDRDPRAAYALWNTDDGHLVFRRISYPLAITQQKIMEAGLPPVLATRLAQGR